MALTVTQSNATSVLVAWQAPADGFRNGNVTYYQVTIALLSFCSKLLSILIIKIQCFWRIESCILHSNNPYKQHDGHQKILPLTYFFASNENWNNFSFNCCFLPLLRIIGWFRALRISHWIYESIQRECPWWLEFSFANATDHGVTGRVGNASGQSDAAGRATVGDDQRPTHRPDILDPRRCLDVDGPGTIQFGRRPSHARLDIGQVARSAVAAGTGLRGRRRTDRRRRHTRGHLGRHAGRPGDVVHFAARWNSSGHLVPVGGRAHRPPPASQKESHVYDQQIQRHWRYRATGKTPWNLLFW